MEDHVNGSEPTKKVHIEEKNALSELKKYTKVVADTGNFNDIA